MPLPKQNEVKGYNGEILPWTLWEQPSGSAVLAVVFPGFGYNADLPVLYYPALQLFSSGADVARLEKRYNEVHGFMDQPDGEQDRWLAADAGAVLSASLGRRKYQRVILVGKSLGTISAALCLQNRPDLPRVSCAWLTPVLSHPLVWRELAEGAVPGIVAIGTRDHFFDPHKINQLKTRPNLSCLVFPEADHSLEKDGDVTASIQYIQELTAAVAKLGSS